MQFTVSIPNDCFPPPLLTFNNIIVFDVTDSGFYSSSGRYHVFAGKDLTLCLIKSSLDPAMTNNLNMEQEGITTGQIEGKVDFYRKKYKRVGWLKEWKDINGDKAIYSS